MDHYERIEYIRFRLHETIEKLSKAEDALERKSLREIAADYANILTALE